MDKQFVKFCVIVTLLEQSQGGIGLYLEEHIVCHAQMHCVILTVAYSLRGRLSVGLLASKREIESLSETPSIFHSVRP